MNSFSGKASRMKEVEVSMKFRIYPAIFLILLLLLPAACDRQKARQAPPAPEVGTITVKEQGLELFTELPGRTSAYLVAEVRPQVSGIIQKRQFEEGSLVKKGDILYRIDPAPFQAAYNSALASLGRSEANLPALRVRADRYRELIDAKAVSKQDVDDTEAAYRQAEADVKYWKAAVDAARINLGYTKIMAPISGRIGKSNMTEGALVTANQPTPLAVIQQCDPIYLDVPQSTTELLRLKRRVESGSLAQDGKGQKKVRLVLEDGTTYSREGTLQFRDITVEQSTGSVTLRAVFPNPDGILLPGMFVRAVLQEGTTGKAILVPQHAVSRDPKGNPLALVMGADGKVQQRQLAIDRAVGNQWLVTSGIAAGDRVIIEGMQKVRPGAPAKAVPASDTVTPDATAQTGRPSGQAK